MNLKIPGTVFCLFPFQIFKKAYLRIWKCLGQFFCLSPFQIFEKAYLQIWKHLGQFFCSSPFQIFKKAYLQIWKYLGQCFAYPLFKYLNNHTCQFQNTLFIPIIIVLKETIYIKTITETIYITTIIQIYKHKVKYIITACIPIIIIKKL